MSAISARTLSGSGGVSVGVGVGNVGNVGNAGVSSSASAANEHPIGEIVEDHSIKRANNTVYVKK
jgi:hypothetical protein